MNCKLEKTNNFKSLPILMLVFLVLNISSCTFDKLEEFSEIEKEVEQNPIVSIEWTAFKFPIFADRAGVSGHFESFEYRLTPNAGNILDQIMDSEITIKTNSVNVGNSNTKTFNVSEHFFSYFSPIINCKVININQESCEIAITINGVTENVIFEVQLDETERTVKMSGSIEDLMIYGAQDAFDELNKVCGVFHDGFVWPDIAINVSIENYDLLLN